MIRLPSSDFEHMSIDYEDNKLFLLGTYSNHYFYESDNSYHMLFAVIVPKDLQITEVTRTIYYEYEDDLAEKKVVTNFSLKDQNPISEDCIEYSFAEKTD